MSAIVHPIPGVLREGEFLVLDPGDGEPGFMHQQHQVQLVTRPWFKGAMWHEEAYLFLVLSDDHDERYVALSSRSIASIGERMQTEGWASVVVHRIDNPGDAFDPGSASDSLAIGMTTITRV